jgi:hypothetical protein
LTAVDVTRSLDPDPGQDWQDQAPELFATEERAQQWQT